MADDKSTKARELEKSLGIKEHDKTYIGTDGFVRTSARDTISANQANENANSRGSAGGCTQSSDNVPDKSDKKP